MSEPGEITKKNQPEIDLNVSPELCVGAVASDGFMRALRNAAKVTQRTAHEAGFFIALTNDNEYWVSLVREGTASGMDREPETKREKDKDQKEFEELMSLDITELLDVHFHPGCDPMPSFNDLVYLSTVNLDPDHENKPRTASGIGIVDKNGKIDLLLMRIISKGIPRDFLIEDVVSSCEDVEFPFGDWSPSASKKSELLTVLNNSGFYKAIFVSLPKNEDKWSDAEIEALKDFFK